jgi:hypothetical protein
MTTLTGSPIKTYIFLILTSISFNTIAQEDRYKPALSIQKLLNKSKSSIEFERTDSNIKWFDDKNIYNDDDLIYGLIIPLNYINFNYKRHVALGTHTGEALQETCIFLNCFWANESLLSELDNNEEVQYKIINNELWLDKPFYIENSGFITISPLIGVNILPIEFVIKGSGQQISKNATLPIPFWGVNIEKQLSKTIKVTGEFRHLNYDHGDWGVLYQNYQIGIEKKLTKHFDISVGLLKYRLNTKYNKNSKDAEFNLSLKSPFFKISTHF